MDWPVEEIMKRHVVTAEPGESLLEAECIMRLARIRHLPVVRGGMLVGLISHRDVVEASIPPAQPATAADRAAHLDAIPIEQILKGEPYTVESDCPACDAAQRMLHLKIGCLPVVEPEPGGLRLLGLVTESDLLRRAYVPGFEGASD